VAKLKYFFPDSQDFVDPSFDFLAETRNEHRVRQRDDQYPHEIFTKPYDGILVSKAIVDGLRGSTGKYTQAQRRRFYREQVRTFFRLSESYQSMGDCGAFTYADMHMPPYSVDEVVDFYENSGFDFGISLDHIVFAYETPKVKVVGESLEECIRRQNLTLEYADIFLDKSRSKNFIPMGVAHGWNPESYKDAVEKLISMGYEYITLGGMVPLKTNQILEVLKFVSQARTPTTKFHLLGISRLENVEAFEKYGVTSIDSTTPLRQAFKDDKKNFHRGGNEYFTALRIPQLDGNLTMSRKIKSGEIDQDEARHLEKGALDAVRAYAKHEVSLETALNALMDYKKIYADNEKYRDEYQRTLEARPWDSCSCEICRTIGVEVILFRGSERNKRRGFHNINALYQRLHNVS
jgi:hypothetical protein